MHRPVRSTRIPILGPVLALAAIALSTGCDKAAAPSNAALPGTYTLVALNDRPLPAVLHPGPTGSTNMPEGTITLREDRTYVQTTLRRSYRADGSPSPGPR